MLAIFPKINEVLREMIRFTIFGIPVEIQPWFWVMIFLLGGGMSINGSEDLMQILTFAIIVLISVIVHELGHALVGLKVAGGSANIILWGMGGLAQNVGGRFDRRGRMLMILAGPGAGLLLGILIVLALAVMTDITSARGFASRIITGKGEITTEILNYFDGHAMRYYIFVQFIYVNFIWSFVNLLPVYPLDGGQLADLFIKNRKNSHMLGLVTGASVAIYFATHGQTYAALLFGLLAFQNYVAMSKQ